MPHFGHSVHLGGNPRLRQDADTAPEHVPGVICPFCGAEECVLASLFASQLMFSAYQCRACRSYFEALREDKKPKP